jgi:hypothetical protein
MRRGESVMIATVFSISECTFEVITVNYIRVGEVDNCSTDTTLMIFTPLLMDHIQQ